MTSYPALIFTDLRGIVFNEDASYKELLTVAAAMGAFWVVFFQVMNHILRFLSYDKPWLRLAMERDYSRADKEELKKQGTTSKEEFIEKNMKEWPNSISMSLQHVVGALGCIPFLVRWLILWLVNLFKSYILSFHIFCLPSFFASAWDRGSVMGSIDRMFGWSK